MVRGSNESGGAAMDLSGLNPAPWVVLEDSCGDLYIQAGKRNISLLAGEMGGPGERLVLEFVALARNAFEVIMRRGWGVLPCRSVTGYWVAKDSEGTPFDAGCRENCPTLYWPDPFTALVEADAWYREHVEGAQ